MESNLFDLSDVDKYSYFAEYNLNKYVKLIDLINFHNDVYELMDCVCDIYLHDERDCVIDAIKYAKITDRMSSHVYDSLCSEYRLFLKAEEFLSLPTNKQSELWINNHTIRSNRWLCGPCERTQHVFKNVIDVWI